MFICRPFLLLLTTSYGAYLFFALHCYRFHSSINIYIIIYNYLQWYEKYLIITKIHLSTKRVARVIVFFVYEVLIPFPFSIICFLALFSLWMLICISSASAQNLSHYTKPLHYDKLRLTQPSLWPNKFQHQIIISIYAEILPSLNRNISEIHKLSLNLYKLVIMAISCSNY